METALNAITHALTGAAEVPEWVHLVPAATFSGADGRGPFTFDARALIEASMLPGRKLPIDINHSIDVQSEHGQATPAVGWIVEMQSRADGVWGRVEWTEAGQRALAAREYGYLSPVFTHTKVKPMRVHQLLRAALTNNPNLTLTALHNRNQGDHAMEKELREALGLPDASTEDLLSALNARLAAGTAAVATMAKVAEAAGLGKDAKGEDIVTALQARKSGGDADELEKLRGEVKSLNTQLTTVVTASAKTAAETAITAAIEAGKIVPALRDHMIARHIKNPAEVEAEIKLLPSLHAGGLGNRHQSDDPDAANLNDADHQVIAQMGLSAKAFAANAKLHKEAF